MSEAHDDALRRELETLRTRLAEAEQTLDAIRAGDVDALVVGDAVYTLDSAGAVSNRLRSDVLAQMKDAVVAVDDEGRVIYLNAAAELQYGRAASETLGHPLDHLFAVQWYRDDDAATTEASLRSSGAWRGERIHQRRDGTILHVESTITSLRDSGPAAGGRLIVSRDVSERYRAEAALQEAMRSLARSERQFATLVENSPFIFARFDRELRHVYVSPMIESVTGLAPAAFVGRTHAQIDLPAELAAELTTLVRGVFENGTVADTRFSYHTPSGVRHYEARLVPEISRDGVVESVLSIASDVTEREVADSERRVAAASLREADRRKDVFLATLAHELRNPLAPIGNALQVMRLSADEAAQARAREMIERQLGQLVHLVDDLLDVSRISQGKVELRRERIELSAVIRNAVETSRPVVDASRHALEVSLAPAPEIAVDGDMTRLTQVVANLLNNAAKYTPAGGRIVVSTRREGDEAVVEVADTGVGIAAGQLAEVFQMFTQVDRAAGRSQGGLGIGLALVRRLVEMHGGTVLATSAGPGLGSSFQVRLPLLETASEVADRVEPGDAAPAHGDGIRVLVADDNHDSADSMAMMLGLMGFEAVVAYDGDEALRVAESARPHVAILDIGMPRLDGVEVAKRLRADERLRDMLLIALSGWGRDGDRRRTRDAGFDHHLVKPVDLDALGGLLASVDAGARAAS
ncbi:MAG: ATP-binding protein [Caldimonas sp.]